MFVALILARYWAFKNAWSIDGLPGMKKALEVGKAEKVEPIKKMVGPLAPRNNKTGGSGVSVETAFVIAFASLITGVLLTLYGQNAVAVVLNTQKAVLPKALNIGALFFDSIPVLGSDGQM